MELRCHAIRVRLRRVPGRLLRPGLIIDYGKPVVWFGMGVADVERYIALLQGKLAEMKGTGG